MKCVITLAAILAICCAGCLSEAGYWPGVFPRPYQRIDPSKRIDIPDEFAQEGDEAAPAPEGGPRATDEPGGPVLGPVDGPDDLAGPPLGPPTDDRPAPKLVKEPARIMPRRMAVGFSLGNVYGNKGYAVGGVRETDFENGMLVGASFLYVPAMKETRFSPNFITRYALEARIEDHGMMLNENGLDLGKVYTTSAVFLFKLLQEPVEGGIFGFHFDIGMGWGSTWFEKDNMLKQDDIDNGRYTKISTDRAMIFTFGAGADLVIAPDAAVSLDLRYQDISIPVKWSQTGVYRMDVEELNANSAQVVLTFRYFF